MEEPNQKLEVVRKKLKIWRIAFFLIGLLFIVYIYQGYIDDRKQLSFKLSDYIYSNVGITNQLLAIRSEMENRPGSDYNTELMNSEFHVFNNAHNRLPNYLNRFENRQLENSRMNPRLYIQRDFLTLIDLMQRKQVADQRAERDVDLLNEIIAIFTDYNEFLEEERKNLNGLFNRFPLITATASVTHTIDVNKMGSYFDMMNSLTHFYLLYQQTPEDLAPLSEDEITKKLLYVLDIDENEIEEMRILEDQTLKKYNFTIFRENQTGTIRGQINGYGFLNEVYLGGPPVEDELVDKELVEESLIAFLERAYEDVDFVIHDRGINYERENYGHDTQLYSYEVEFSMDGYVTEDSLMVYYNGKNGNLVQLEGWNELSGGFLFDPSFYELDSEGILTPDEALTNYNDLQGTGVEANHMETVIIWSNLSGRYVFAHQYTSGLYLHAHTGKVEKPSERRINRRP